eukprot:g43305.t1
MQVRQRAVAREHTGPAIVAEIEARVSAVQQEWSRDYMENRTKATAGSCAAAFVDHTLLAESEALSHYPGTQLLVFASAARTSADGFRFMRQVLRDCLVRCRPVAKVIVPNCGGALIEPVFPGSLLGAVRCALETIYRECQGGGAPVPAFSLHYYLFGLGCDAHAPPITAALNLLNFHDRYPRSRGRFDDNLAEHFYQRYLATRVAPGPALAGWAAAYELLCNNSCENSWWWIYFNVYICGQPEYARLLLANTNGQGEEALEEFDHEFLGISNPERAMMARKLLASCYMIDFL